MQSFNTDVPHFPGLTEWRPQRSPSSPTPPGHCTDCSSPVYTDRPNSLLTPSWQCHGTQCSNFVMKCSSLLWNMINSRQDIARIMLRPRRMGCGCGEECPLRTGQGSEKGCHFHEEKLTFFSVKTPRYGTHLHANYNNYFHAQCFNTPDEGDARLFSSWKCIKQPTIRIEIMVHNHIVFCLEAVIFKY